MTRTELCVWAALAIPLVFATGACGGGGNGTVTGGSDAFNGTYFFGAFEGSAGPAESRSHWGQLTANGAGMVPTITGSTNDEGTIGALGATPFAYALGPAGQLNLMTGGGGVVDQQGGISASGSMAIAAGILASNDPSILFSLRKAGTFSNASLTGTYRYCMFFDWDSGTDGDSALWGTATFTPATGVVSFSHTINSDGIVTGPHVLPETYTVAGDGTFTATLDGGSLAGGVLAGGQIAYLSGGTLGGGSRLLAVFVKQSTSASLATFAGAYHFVAMVANDGPAPVPHWLSHTGTATSNNLGQLTFGAITRLNDDGTIQTLPAGATANYTVAANGAMTMDGGGGASGGVAPDGGLAVVAGSTAGTQGPEFWIFLR